MDRSSGSLGQAAQAGMSKRRDIEDHIRSLAEISAIMRAMKNLAVMEIQKLTRLLSAQERVVATMQEAGSDFLTFYPEALLRTEDGRPLYLIIGSERGFCGDYNDKLFSSVQERLQLMSNKHPVLFTVGRKLAARVSDNRHAAVFIDGPSVAEEVQSVLIQVMDHMHELKRQEPSDRPLTITVVSYASQADGVVTQTLRPFEMSPGQKVHFTDPPLLNLPPRVFLAELMDLYFFSLLHKIFYSALLAENRGRVSHLEGAIQRLERETSELELKRNILRQEEITEEIELLMLSAERLRQQ
jgi:F-type H+-transporting ATPase subunit gamma